MSDPYGVPTGYVPRWVTTGGAKIDGSEVPALSLPSHGELWTFTFDSRPVRLIGLTAPARSGKDTVADYMVREHGFVKHSFAAPIRELAARILGISLEELEATKEQPVGWLGGITPRRMMQTVGTEWGRNIDPALWIKSALRRAQADMAWGRSVVICDVRFDNEAVALRSMGGKVWRIERPAAGTASTHASETPIDSNMVDATVSNSSTIHEMTELVRHMLMR